MSAWLRLTKERRLGGVSHVREHDQQGKLDGRHLAQLEMLHDERAKEAKTHANKSRPNAGEEKLRDDLQRGGVGDGESS